MSLESGAEPNAPSGITAAPLGKGLATEFLRRSELATIMPSA
jgi:hypothetical protein